MPTPEASGACSSAFYVTDYGVDADGDDLTDRGDPADLDDSDAEVLDCDL